MNKEEIPPLAESLFDHILITSLQPQKCILVTATEAYGDHWGPEKAVAEQTTYALELSPKDKSLDAKGAEKTRRAFERWMETVIEGEPFRRFGGWNETKKVTLEGNPPVVKVSGLTYDMLKELIHYNLLESNISVAHSFDKARRNEYRGPPMSALGANHDPDDENNPYLPAENYQRGKIDIKSVESIGDLGIAQPHQAYEHAVRSLVEGKERGYIKTFDDLERAARFVADSTRSGLLPSPYQTERQLLGDGASDEDRQHLATERFEQIASDMRTLSEHTKLQRTEERRKGADLPSWWLGTAEEWKSGQDRGLEQWLARHEQFERDVAAAGGSDSIIDTAIGDWKGLSKQQSHEKSRKEELKRRRQESTALSTHTLSPEEREMFSAHDLTFFGVTHEWPIYTYKKGWVGLELGDFGEKVTYTSRNPLIDPPRDLPRSLQVLLDKEQTPERKMLGAGR